MTLPNVNTSAPFRVTLPPHVVHGHVRLDWDIYRPTMQRLPQHAIPAVGGFLRSLHLSIRTWGDPIPDTNPRGHAADRTRSRRARAGSRRTKRYGLTPAGARRTGWLEYDDFTIRGR